MMRAMACLATILALWTVQARAGDALSVDRFWVTPNAGTLGPGVEAGWRWNEQWGARAGFNGFATPFVYHDKDSDLVSRLTLLSAGLTADYYPFGGDFRFSGGARLAANRIDGHMRNFKKHVKGKGGDISVTIKDPLTDFSITQNALQPYIGAGYSLEIEERVSLALDFGMLYAGTPQITAHSQYFSQHQVDRELDKARDRIAAFKIYPVIQIGLNIKF